VPRRALAALLALITVWPSVVLGQDKAGVVTTLEGNVTAARPAVAQLLPLKFRDDVYQNDRITTGDRSLARVLLGGKAIVTVRERSVVTITELPGKSTIQLAAGKIGLAVAKERMRPGESIEVKTPNAVAAVRGTVIVAEVERATAQAGASVPGVVTHFWVLRGTIDVFQLVPGTSTPVGSSYQVSTLQGFTAAGSAPPTVGNIPPGLLGQITGGLTPSTPQQTQGGGQDSIVTQQVHTAVTLSEILSPGPPPPPPLTNNNNNLCTGTTCSGDTGGIVSDPGFLTLVNSGTFDKTLFTLLSGDMLVPSSGGGSLFLVPAGGNVTLTGNALLLDATDALINPGSICNVTLLKIDGTVTTSSTSSSPTGLLNIDPTTVNAATIVDVGTGGTLNLAGALLRDKQGKYTVTADFLRVNGTVQPLPAAPTAPSEGLVFLGSQVVAGNLVSIPSGQVTLNGLLVEVAPFGGKNASLNISGALLDIGADGRLASNTGLPVAFGQGNGPLHLAGSLLAGVGGATVDAGAIANIAGTLNLTAGSLLNDVNGIYTVNGAFVAVTGDGAVVAPGLSPGLLRLDGTNATAGAIARLQDNALLEASAPVLLLINSARVSVQSDAVRLADNATLASGRVTAPIDVFSLNASRLTLLAGASLANVRDNSRFLIFGNLFSLNKGSTLTITNGALVNVSGNGLFSLSNGSLGVFGATGTNTLNVLTTSGGGAFAAPGSIQNLDVTKVPVLLRNNATAAQVTVAEGFVPFKTSGTTNVVNIPSGSAALIVDGPGAKIKLGP